MRTTNPRALSYPVLREVPGDYLTSTIVAGIDEQLSDAGDLALTYQAYVTNDDVSQLIADGAAEILFHLECPSTGYRRTVVGSPAPQTITISGELLARELQVCSFVVASKRIVRFSSEDLHGDYAGADFTFEVGYRIAEGSMYSIDLMSDGLDHAASIVNISLGRPDQESLEVILRDDKIAVLIPEAQYRVYTTWKRLPSMAGLLHSMVLVPSIAYALERADSPDYEGLRWWNVLSRAIEMKSGGEVNPSKSGFGSIDALEWAQRLLDHPLNDGMAYVNEGGLNSCD